LLSLGVVGLVIEWARGRRYIEGNSSYALGATLVMVMGFLAFITVLEVICMVPDMRRALRSIPQQPVILTDMSAGVADEEEDEEIDIDPGNKPYPSTPNDADDISVPVYTDEEEGGAEEAHGSGIVRRARSDTVAPDGASPSAASAD
jgi:hypothetical protein